MVPCFFVVLCFVPCVTIFVRAAAKGEEAYTVGILSAWDFLAYTSAMAGAKDASDGDHLKVAGGMTSLSFDEKLGKTLSEI